MSHTNSSNSGEAATLHTAKFAIDSGGWRNPTAISAKACGRFGNPLRKVVTAYVADTNDFAARLDRALTRSAMAANLIDIANANPKSARSLTTGKMGRLLVALGEKLFQAVL
jgi:hypothetical protein